MTQIDLQRFLEEAVASVGADQVASALQQLTAPIGSAATTLTIISNAGLHEIPSQYLRGEVYEASRGNWQTSTEEALCSELTVILGRLANKLRSRHWQRVYLIPTGHPVLSLQLKSMVYRVLRMNTIDLYHKAGTYFEVDIDQRAVALHASAKEGV